MMRGIKKILLVRRDNIGDLVCTTPSIKGLRDKYPDLKIGVLVNAYNHEIVRNNPDIDDVFVYKKAKHSPEKMRLAVWMYNVRLMLGIRRKKYDVAVACGSSYSARLARYTFISGARLRIGYTPGGRDSRCYNMPLEGPGGPVNEVVSTYRLLEPLGITGDPPGLVLRPDEAEIFKADAFLESRGIDPEKLVGIHISSRRPENRWPKERFAKLSDSLVNKYGVSVVIMWSPGASDNPFHPGDDEAANWIAANTCTSVVLFPTDTLSTLIAAIKLPKVMICLDGGAMHIAAALGRPTLTAWGSTDKRRWSPWGNESIIIQNGERAEDVTVTAMLSAFQKLWRY